MTCNICGRQTEKLIACEVCRADYSRVFSRSLLMDATMLPALAWAAARGSNHALARVEHMIESRFPITRELNCQFPEPPETLPPVRVVSPKEMRDRDQAYVLSARQHPRVQESRGEFRKKK